MRSFAVWFNGNKINDIPMADIHVNLIESKRKGKWNIDFGIKIYNIEDVDNIFLFCPFIINKIDEIKDLATILDTKLLKALFNENLQVTDGYAKRKYVSILPKNDEKFIVYEIDVNREITIKGINDNNEHGTIITIDIKDIKKSVREQEEIKDINTYYFRFRIGIPYSGSSLVNNEIDGLSVASCTITKTEIIDFRLNNIRSLGDCVQDEINKGKKFVLKSVHLLILKKAKDLLMYPSDHPNTRMLEADLWQNYFSLGNTADVNDLVAYHFKEKKTDEKEVNEFNILVRFSTMEITWKAIVLFISFAVILNILCSVAFEYFRQL